MPSPLASPRTSSHKVRLYSIVVVIFCLVACGGIALLALSSSDSSRIWGIFFACAGSGSLLVAVAQRKFLPKVDTHS